MIPSAKQGKSSNQPTLLSKDSLDALNKLIQDKLASLETRIVSVEDHINKHHGQFIDIIKDIEKKAIQPLV